MLGEIGQTLSVKHELLSHIQGAVVTSYHGHMVSLDNTWGSCFMIKPPRDSSLIGSTDI